MNTALLHLTDVPHILSDGYLCDDRRSLLFLSCWGRDTAIQELLARLSLKNEEGLSQLMLTDSALHEHLLFPGEAENLDKRSTRHQHTRFGTLVHLWLYDRRCLTPDRANGRAFLLLRRDDRHWRDRLWLLLKETTSLPLLEHWQDGVLDYLQSTLMATAIGGYGDLTGWQLQLDTPQLTAFISDAIRSGTLSLTPLTSSDALSARHVA